MHSAFPEQEAEVGDGEGFADRAEGRGNRAGLINSGHGAKEEGEERRAGSGSGREEAMLPSLVTFDEFLSDGRSRC